jgi:hypothetical protein
MLLFQLSETWLNNCITDYEVIPNEYQIFRTDRSTGKRGGGVLLALKDSISIPILRVLITVCYRPPNADSDFFHNLNSFMEFAIKSNLKEIILLGDFNFPTIRWINGSEFPVTLCETSFTDSLQDHGFLQLVASPTRGSNILDLTLTTNECLVD